MKCARKSRGRGQASIEYLIVAAVLLGMLSLFGVFQYTQRSHAARTLALAGSEFP